MIRKDFLTSLYNSNSLKNKKTFRKRNILIWPTELAVRHSTSVAIPRHSALPDSVYEFCFSDALDLLLHRSAFLAGWFNQGTELSNFQDHTQQQLKWWGNIGYMNVTSSLRSLRYMSLTKKIYCWVHPPQYLQWRCNSNLRINSIWWNGSFTAMGTH